MATEEIPTIFFSGKSWKKNLGDFLLPPGYDFIQPIGRDGSNVKACYSLCEIVRTSQCVGRREGVGGITAFMCQVHFGRT